MAALIEALLDEAEHSPKVALRLARIVAPHADLFAARVFASAIEKAQQSLPPYSSRRGCGPNGVSHRRWQALAKTIGTRAPGARYWIVDRAAYQRWVAGDRERPPAPAPRVPVADTWRDVFEVRGANGAAI